MSTPHSEPRIATWSPGPRGPARIYKHKAKGQTKKQPGSCIACWPDNVAGQDVPLKHGVTLVLCKHHRTPERVGELSGRPFLAAISALFHSMGLRSARHHAALRAFVQDMTNPHRQRPTPPRPGSYAWPERRQDAETVWSRGGSFAQGLRAALGGSPDVRARAPTERTVRRWWHDRRWLEPPPPMPVRF